jgi:hypothetical protein
MTCGYSADYKYTDNIRTLSENIKFSSQSSNSRGVAILFRNTFQYHIEKEIKDSDGNFIILSVRINNTRQISQAAPS